MLEHLWVKCQYWVIFCFNADAKLYIKMNEIVKKFLLASDKSMPEMHLKQPGFTYSVCEPFTKNKERIQKFKEKGDRSYIYQNELDKAYLIWLMEILKI